MARRETSALERLYQMVREWLDQMTSKVPSKIQRYMPTINTVGNEARLRHEEI